MITALYQHHPVLGVAEVIHSTWSVALVRKELNPKEGNGYRFFTVSSDTLSNLSVFPEKAPSNPTQDYTTLDFRTNNEYLWEWE